jgi:hypothetical protein
VRLHRSKEQEYKELLHTKTKQILETVEFFHPFFQLDKDELLGTEFAKGTLERWLDDELKRHEQEESSTKFAPALMEVSFGRATRNATAFDAVTLHVEDNRELKIKGAVDRVEIAHSDADSSSFSFRISDYKSGNIDKYKEKKTKKNEQEQINEPMQYFQMPLYIASVKEILQQQFGIQQATITGGRYYSFQKEQEARTVDVLTEKPEELIQKSIEQAITIQENIANNSFAVQPIKEDSCTYCSYKPICRITYNTSACEQINEEDNE